MRPPRRTAATRSADYEEPIFALWSASRCSIAVSVRDADVVIEGDAVRVTEPGALARIAKAWAGTGWPAEPDNSGPGITAPFNAPSQGPPPWNVYRIEPRSAVVTLAAEPGGLNRFRL